MLKLAQESRFRRRKRLRRSTSKHRARTLRSIARGNRVSPRESELSLHERGGTRGFNRMHSRRTSGGVQGDSMKSPRCPKCRVSLFPSQHHPAFLFCRRCHGRAASFKSLHDDEFSEANLAAAMRLYHERHVGRLSCPFCDDWMFHLEWSESARHHFIHYCKDCKGLWFGTGKYRNFIQRETSSIRNLEWHDFSIGRPSYV